jgi:hypothetical protein
MGPIFVSIRFAGKEKGWWVSRQLTRVVRSEMSDVTFQSPTKQGAASYEHGLRIG